MSDTSIPSDHLYTQEHEWVLRDGNQVTVGISDYAQDSLGELVYVELPSIGDEFSKGDDMVIVESCKAASDVYAPVSGKVVEVNDNLDDSPNLVNESPYEQGWLVKIELSDESELDELLNSDTYAQHVE